MSYDDLLRKYQRLDRTRIFGPDWRITQQWTSLHVPWSADYHQTRFSVTVTRTTPVVIVLSQLDRTYFAGLEGQYNFKLQFRVQRVGDEEDYIVRSNVDYYMTRSVSTDITLEAGSYFVLMKITAIRVGGSTLDEIIADCAEDMRDKLIQVGLSYDIAHAKGVIVETEQEKEERELYAKAQAAASREKRKNEVKARKEQQWKRDKMFQKRRNMQAKRRERFADERAARHRNDEAADGFNSEEKDLDPRPDYESGSAAVSDGRSFTGEFIAAYEQSEGPPTPMIPGAEDGANQSPTNDASQPLPSPPEEKSISNAAENSVQDHPPTPKVQVNGVDAVTNVKPLKKRPAPLTPRLVLEQSYDDDDQGQQEHPQQSESFADPQWSDSDTASEFDWQTDLDYDSQDGRSPYGRSEPDRQWDQDRERDQDDDSGPEPWNAVCVVGLRVYSKDPDLLLEVVRPNPYRDDNKQDVGAAPLDRDDPAKGAVAEKWAKTPMRETFGSDDGALSGLGGYF
jgi:GTP cyclohydrolase II